MRYAQVMSQVSKMEDLTNLLCVGNVEISCGLGSQFNTGDTSRPIYKDLKMNYIKTFRNNYNKKTTDANIYRWQ
ncbi:MAG: hypothetical protein IPO94_19905 [Saprospiraceae bacterium]|nr:hypothetical protein [Saprospiraceae bacterium]